MNTYQLITDGKIFPKSMKLENITQKIYADWKLPLPADRREVLITKMKELSNEGKNCSSCNGMCCTFVYNSMQTTPLETIEIIEFLNSQGRLNEQMINALEACVSSYRLDKDLGLGEVKKLRRTYTCPFFEPGAKGCSIALDKKPYGCLGFNPFETNVSQEGKCKVYVDTHNKREEKFSSSEKKVNEDLKKELELNWDKLPMPLAIINMLQALNK